MAYDLVVVPPHALASKFGAASVPQGFTGCLQEVLPPMLPESLLTFAARKAFVGWTVPSMQQLLRWGGYGLPGDRMPQTEMDVMSCLVRAVIPDLSDDQAMDILSLRNERKANQYRSVINSPNIHLAEELVDPGDTAPIKRQVQKSSEQTAERFRPDGVGGASSSSSGAPLAAVPPAEQTRPSLVDAPAGDGGDAGPRVVAPAPQPRPVFGHAVDISEARSYCPNALGVSLSQHSGKAWQGKYLRRTTPGPKSHMRTWHDGPSHRSALLAVLRWLWARHVEAGGEVSPWDLSADLA